MSHLKDIVKHIIPERLSRPLISIYKAFYYRGNNVECPCCGRTFDRFIDYIYTDPFGKLCRPDEGLNTLCPYCLSLPRHRIVCNYFNTMPTPISQRILMFGAELSIKQWFKTKGYRYTTADLFDKSADVQTDIQQTSFPDESWTLIICNHVLEHVLDYRKALRELRRILRKDGILELTVPTDRSLRTVHEDISADTDEKRFNLFGHPEHYRIFGNDIDIILTQEGFTVEVISGDSLPLTFRTVVGPSWFDDNRVYICRKI
jgi:predicted SAM-dependent methyltransferase